MSHLIKNITLHQLIDYEDPHCCYCHCRCNISVESNMNVSQYPAPAPWIHINKYYCESCDEVFRVHFLDSGSVISFEFTCKDVWVSIYYDTENFSLEKRVATFSPTDVEKRHWINGLDNVEFDFSNKEKLYNKIKTYLVFS